MHGQAKVGEGTLTRLNRKTWLSLVSVDAPLGLLGDRLLRCLTKQLLHSTRHNEEALDTVPPQKQTCIALSVCSCIVLYCVTMITYAMNICICGISMCITDLFKVGSEKIRTAPLDPSVARWYKCRAASVNGPPLSFSARRACNSPCIDSLDKIWSMLATSPSTARVQKVPSCLNSARLDQPWPACHRTSNSRQIEVSYSCCSNKLLETAWSINLSCCWIRHVMRANDWEPECKIICQGLQRDI